MTDRPGSRTALAQVLPERTWTKDEIEAAAPLAPLPAGIQPVIAIRDLHKGFGSRKILRGIDLDVLRGETLCILGGSGSGKTTLIRHLMGMLKADVGTIQVAPAPAVAGMPSTEAGFELGAANEEQLATWRRRLGVVFQGAALLGSLTVLENVGLPLVEVDHRPANEIYERVVEALRRVYLPAQEILHLKPASLSGGMRKRVGIARAIIQRPEIILYDEPTTGLDPVTVSGVNELTLDLQKKLGITSIVITHDLEAAFTIADRIAMLYRGRIIAIGPTEEFRHSPNPAVQQLLTGSTRGPLTEAYLQGTSES
ncbi:ABC transporter ATP-binding protein [Planctomycetota bacterium]|nr:ABC transporter ATP-binding protein [Planctomycetota bacterium]